MKSLEEFVALFAEQFDETDASEFKPTTIYHELEEWSSLRGLLIMAMVADEFGIELKADDIRKSVTIEDIYNTIQSH